MKVYSNSAFINVRQSSNQYISNVGNQHVGQVNFNTATQELEIFDGSRWVQFDNNIAELSLSFEAEESIRWASRKMKEEQELEEKMKKYPALKDAYEQFKTVEALIHEEENS